MGDIAIEVFTYRMTMQEREKAMAALDVMKQKEKKMQAAADRGAAIVITTKEQKGERKHYEWI